MLSREYEAGFGPWTLPIRSVVATQLPPERNFTADANSDELPECLKIILEQTKSWVEQGRGNVYMQLIA